MFKVKIQGKSYNIPQTMSEVTIKRFIDFRNIDQNNPLAVCHWILNDTPTFSDEDKIEQELANVLSLATPLITEIYAFTNSKDKEELPKSIEMLGKVVKVNKGMLNSLPVWAYAITKKLILDEAKKDFFDPTEQIPRVLAHYLYTIFTGNEYREHYAEEYIEIVNDVPMKEALQLGGFFLKKHSDCFPLSKRALKARLTQTT